MKIPCLVLWILLVGHENDVDGVPIITPPTPVETVNEHRNIAFNYSTTTLLPERLRDVFVVGIFISQTELPIHLETVKPALDLAVTEANRLYPDFRFRLVVRTNTSASCINNNAGVFAAEEYYLRKVSAFIGPICSVSLDPVARMAAYWNVPVFTSGGVGVQFADKQIYSSLTRLAFSMDRVSLFLVQILKEFNWHHTSLVVDETEMSNTLIKRSLEFVFKDAAYADFLESDLDFDIKLDIQSFKRRRNVTVDYKKVLMQASQSARVIFLIASNDLVRHLLIEAYELGMGNGDYTFIGLELIKSKSSYGDISWYKPGDKRNKQAREMYEAFMLVAVRVPTSPEYQTFVHEVSKKSKEEYGQTGSSSVDVSFQESAGFRKA